MIVASLLLIAVAVALLVLGLTGGSSVLLISSIVASLLAAVALVIGARRAAGVRRAAGPPVADVAAGRGVEPVATYASDGPRYATPAEQYATDEPGGDLSYGERSVEIDDSDLVGIGRRRAASRPQYDTAASPDAAGRDTPEVADDAPAAADTPAEVPAAAAGHAPDAGSARGPEPVPGYAAEQVPGDAGERVSGDAGERVRGDAGERVSGDAGEQVSGYADEEDPADEPAPQAVRPADAVRVARMDAEVLVVDGRPRYHRTDCPFLTGRPTEPLPVAEAVELGFSPCGECRPVDHLVTAAARR
jgi:hypothetical protein